MGRRKISCARWLGGAFASAESAHDDFHIVFAETIQPQALARRMDFPVCADLGVTVPASPVPQVCVKAFPVLDHRREQQKLSPSSDFALQSAAQFITGLGFDGNIAVRTKLRSQSREKQSKKMIELGDGGDGALAAAPAGALLDTDGGRDAADQVHVRTRKLLDELAGIKAHG